MPNLTSAKRRILYLKAKFADSLNFIIVTHSSVVELRVVEHELVVLQSKLHE